MKDLSYLKDFPIAILGAGAVGKTVGADCKLAGQKVHICDLPPFSESTLKALDKTGLTIEGMQINRYNFYRGGRAFYDVITDDVAACVKGCKIICVCTPSIGHKAFFEKLIPALEDGMIIHIIPDNFGSLLLRKMMREAGCTKKVIIGGWSSAPYGTRFVTEGGIPIPKVAPIYRAITLRGASLPSTDQEEFLKSSEYIGSFDAITQGEGVVGGHTVLDIGFSNVNPVIHVPGTVLGASTMENWGVIYGNDKYDYSIYSHTFCPSVSEVQWGFYQEEVALADALGVGIQPFEKDIFFQRTSVLGPEYMGDGVNVPFTEQWPTGYGTGPFSIQNRYVTEDVPVGCHMYHELGKQFGVPTPIVDSFITIAGVMTGRNFYETGLTCKALGIDHMNKEQLLKYLDEGVYTEAGELV